MTDEIDNASVGGWGVGVGPIQIRTPPPAPAPTSAPVVPITPAPVVPPTPAPTSAPVDPPTSTPVIPAASAPVVPTSAPIVSTPAPIVPTAAPVVSTPAPVPVPTSESKIESVLKTIPAVATTTTTTSCTICTDTPSPYMVQLDKSCDDFNLQQKCNNDSTGNWQQHKYCSQTCFDLDIGYDDETCCPPPTSTPTAPPTASPTASPVMMTTSAGPTSQLTVEPRNVDDAIEAVVPVEEKQEADDDQEISAEIDAGSNPTKGEKGKNNDKKKNEEKPYDAQETFSSIMKTGEDANIDDAETFSPACDAMERGEAYTEGSAIVVGFKYMVVYDDMNGLSDLLSELEQNMQAYAEKSMINCPNSIYVVNGRNTFIDGATIDLPSEPATGCGSANESNCNMLDGYVTILVRDAADISALEATQNALEALRVGMSDGLIGGEINRSGGVSSDGLIGGEINRSGGISSLSFLGGTTAEGEGYQWLPDGIPASARIGETPLRPAPTNQPPSGLNTLGIALIAIAAIGFIVAGAALRRKVVRFKQKTRALFDSDSEVSLDNEVHHFHPDEDDLGEVKKSASQCSLEAVGDCADSLSASCHGSTPAACGAADSDDDNAYSIAASLSASCHGGDVEDSDDGCSIAASSHGGGDGLNALPASASFNGSTKKHTISIHQYCGAPTCAICKSYKKPRFAHMKYKVAEDDRNDEESIDPNNSSSKNNNNNNNNNNDLCEDNSGCYDKNCASTGLVATAWTKIAETSECYLCS